MTYDYVITCVNDESHLQICGVLADQNGYRDVVFLPIFKNTPKVGWVMQATMTPSQAEVVKAMDGVKLYKKEE